MSKDNSLQTPLLATPGQTDSDNNKLSMQVSQSFDAISALNSTIAEMRQCDIPNAKYGFHSTNIYCMAMSPSGKKLYTGSIDTTLKIWNLASGKEDVCVEIYSTPKCLEITKDEKYLIIGAFDSNIKFFNTVFQKFDFFLQGHKKTVTCMKLTKDEKYLISGSEDSSIIIWDIESKAVEVTLSYHTGSILCLALTSNGRNIISGGEDKIIVIWNTLKYRMDFKITCTSKILSLVSFHKFIASGLEDGKIIVWNIIERRQEYCLLGHTLYITHLCLSNDQEFLVSSSGDNTIKLWNLKEKRNYFTIKNLDIIKKVIISSDRKMIYTGSSKGEVQEWTIEEKKSLVFKPHEDISYCVVVSKNSKYLICSSAKLIINVWLYSEQRFAFSLAGHHDLVYALDCSDDEQLLASGSTDKSIKLWNLETRNLLFSLTGHTEQVLCLKFSKDGKFLVSGSRDRTIKYWDLLNQRQVFTVTAHNDLVHTVCFIQQEEYIVSGSFDATIKIWEKSTPVLEHVLEGHTQYIMKVVPTLDDSYLISVSGDKTIKIWNFLERKEEFTLKGHTEAIWGLSLSGDGTEIATSSVDSTIKVWSLAERKEKYSLAGHIGCVTSCAFVNDGSAIVSTSFDSTIRLWKIGLTEDSLNPFEFQSKRDFMSMLSYFRDNEEPLQNHANLLISKHRFNLMHIYSHLGKPEPLKSLLELDPGFLVDGYNHSPLYYSIKKKSFTCTDLLLGYLIRIKEKKPEKIPIYLTAISEEFEMILKTSSQLLPKFIDILLVVEEKTFGIPKFRLPKFNLSLSKKVYQKDFMQVYNNPQNRPRFSKNFEKSIFLELKRSIIAFPMTAGTTESIKFLTTLLACSKIQIFRSLLIRGLIIVKWKSLRKLILFTSFVLWTNLLLMTYLVAFDADNDPVLIAFFSLNILTLAMKLIQVFRLGVTNYLSNVWNLVDIFRFGACMTWIYFLKFVTVPVFVFEITTWLMILLNFIRGITGFRAFNYTRFYTRLVMRSFQDIISFIFIFCYSIIAFGVLLTYNEHDKSITRIWTSSYDLSLGQFQTYTNEEPLGYVSFMLASVINIIVMLSLLISILGDSFDKFQMESIDIDYKEMAEELRIVEILIFCRRKTKVKEFLQICDTERNADDVHNWEGRLRMIEKYNNSTVDAIKETTDYIMKKVNLLETNADKNNKDLESKIELTNAKIEKIENKIDLQFQEIIKFLQQKNK